MSHWAHRVVVEKVAEGISEPLPDLFERDLSLGDPQRPAKGNMVTLVVGMRRCGKTFRLYQEMRRLLGEGVPRARVLYFNFDDERLKPYSSDLLDDVAETFYAQNPDAFDGAYFFLDEIQEVPEWGTFLRRMVDSRKVTMYVTGSSSRMLSSEMPSEFRGRAITRELFPMSFSEYRRFHGDGAEADIHSARGAICARNDLESYLMRGGFIAAQELSRADAFRVLQGYVGQAVAQDVIDRYGLGNPRAASAFAGRCVANSARELSMSKAQTAMKSAGLAVGRASLSALMGYYEESYLVFRVGELSRALSDNPRAVSKVYAVDPGLAAAFSPATADDLGQRLETAVFDALRRRADLARARSISRLLANDDDGKRYEVDFAVGDALLGDEMQLVQVSTELADEKTRAREVDGLRAGMRRLGVEVGTIVHLGSAEELEVEEGTIRLVPAWEWLSD